YMELTALWTLAGAEFFALMGDRALAIEWLERAVRQGDERAAWFARDPSLKVIWGEPRFQQIVASIAARRTSVSPLSHYLLGQPLAHHRTKNKLREVFWRNYP